MSEKKPTIDRATWNALLAEADRRMKATNGHSFLTVLKTRCQLCGRSPKQKGNCPRWFETFCDRLFESLLASEDRSRP